MWAMRRSRIVGPRRCEQSYASVAVVVTCMDDMVAGRVPLKQQACLDEPSSAVVVHCCQCSNCIEWILLSRCARESTAATVPLVLVADTEGG